MVPLDVTNRVLLSFDHLMRLPPETTRVGWFLRAILPPALLSYRQKLGIEGIHLHDCVSLMAAIHPELFEYEEMCGDVEIGGELCRGATVFDRRRVLAWRRNIAVARKWKQNKSWKPSWIRWNGLLSRTAILVKSPGTNVRTRHGRKKPEKVSRDKTDSSGCRIRNPPQRSTTVRLAGLAFAELYKARQPTVLPRAASASREGESLPGPGDKSKAGSTRARSLSAT